MPRPKDPTLTKVLLNLSTVDVEAARKVAEVLRDAGTKDASYQSVLRTWLTAGRLAYGGKTPSEAAPKARPRKAKQP